MKENKIIIIGEIVAKMYTNENMLAWQPYDVVYRNKCFSNRIPSTGWGLGKLGDRTRIGERTAGGGGDIREKSTCRIC